MFKKSREMLAAGTAKRNARIAKNDAIANWMTKDTPLPL